MPTRSPSLQTPRAAAPCAGAPRPLVLLAFVATLAVVGGGCGKKDEGGSSVTPAASSLSLSVVGPDGGAVWHFTVDPASHTHVDLPGLKEDIRGDTSGAEGSLDVVPTDLARSRGEVRIDLSTFTTHTFGTDDDAAQTKHARTWLEAGDADAGDAARSPTRWARYVIRSIDGASASDVTQVAPVRDGADDVRTVTMTVHGRLWIHGHEVDKDDVVDVAFHSLAGAPAGSEPSRVTLRSKQPMRVVLKEHDVRPRDTAGQVLAWTSKLVSKVAETADVTVDLEATRAR